MSRFSPDTWLDAVQLPFAMAQFKGSVYVEPIAPDIRPAFFVILLAVTCLAIFFRKWRKIVQTSDSACQPNRRAAWALITATLVALSAWIITSANGRYGLLAITLCPMAALATLIITTHSQRAWLIILSIFISLQALFLLTADPDDTWSKLTPYRWTEAHADRLSEKAVAPWKDAAETHSLLVVTTKTLTGMTTLYPVFGPKARYMGLGYLDQYSTGSIEYQRATKVAGAADLVYLSRAVPSDPKLRDGTAGVPNPVSIGENERLRRFGLAAADDIKCTLLPERMGTQLQICPLIKISPDKTDPKTELPQESIRVLKSLSEKCPSIFKEVRRPISDDDGGIATSIQDGKYFVEIKRDFNVYIRSRGEHEHRLVIPGIDIDNLNNYSCNKIIDAGLQYWR